MGGSYRPANPSTKLAAHRRRAGLQSPQASQGCPFPRYTCIQQLLGVAISCLHPSLLPPPATCGLNASCCGGCKGLHPSQPPPHLHAQYPTPHNPWLLLLCTANVLAGCHLQGRIAAKRRQLGMAGGGEVPVDISTANMQFLQVELDNLEAEQVGGGWGGGVGGGWLVDAKEVGSHHGSLCSGVGCLWEGGWLGMEGGRAGGRWGRRRRG
jgi:hypothetical protein